MAKFRTSELTVLEFVRSFVFPAWEPPWNVEIGGSRPGIESCNAYFGGWWSQGSKKGAVAVPWQAGSSVSFAYCSGKRLTGLDWFFLPSLALSATAAASVQS